jgi:hypothetical protein
MYLTCILTLLPAASFAQSGPVVRWNNIVGVITAPGVDNPVAGISSGTGPWTASRGKAQIDLATGHVFFEVEGLVLNGGAATGTAGAIANVAGTFICDTGTPTQTLRDTPAVPLSSTGDAIFIGTLGGTPSSCSNPLFLIRVAPNTGSPTRWIAVGVVRQTDASGN